MRIIGVHGYKSSSKKNFWPFLYDELRKLGHEVIIPDLPNPEAPDPEEWVQTLLDQVGTLNGEDIIVGHSLGAPTALKFLEAAEARSTPHAVVLISPTWRIEAERFRGFFLSELDYEVLMWRAKLFTVIHDRNDTVIPFSHGEKYAKMLQADMVTTQTNGHFDEAEYPAILDTIIKLINTEAPYAPGQSLNDEFSGLH
jgi:predicted alpha/beta hydrolase family esterase